MDTTDGLPETAEAAEAAGAAGTEGLRERKKRQTRAALSQATIALSVQHGWDEVRIEDIAAAVNVSERTFRNYFSSKAEAVAATHLDRMLRVTRRLEARPADEPLWESIRTSVQAEFAPESPEGSRPVDPAAGKRHTEAIWKVLSEPAVQGEVLRADQEAQVLMAAAVAARTGTDPQADLYPKLVAASVGAAIGTALTHWLRADPPVPLGPLMSEVLEQLTAGLPAPAHSES
ncbi:TetR/AcrR family transcriptional regulator [Actinacidiphila bryophytorum]|uniref:Transcriptional regulator, TetR family n=1 Tax=Actinacidiphila bryophytorum TaxID=1436133 RepID=A0A9W4EC45_9ACTN|nr:TetR family transcriptional regulator [Actinacidiphila bryophytorum]MBM9436484.1 TetR family transcriptional regulator [Actinacidiphila bryophytorum]MBN6544514.1 TetR family transcriptional regulator [Actinacidiphila bryophytorum]CAG7601085.1 Transcriptional regulator, TetR family [Actinacidiphila bryophytorum]